MFALFFLGVLASGWLHWGPIAGGSFLIGCVAAALRTKPRDLLTVVVSPPLLFLCAVLCGKALTATGNAFVSVTEGTALTLANVAPWLFAGVILALIIAWARGLHQCVRDLRMELRPELARLQRGPRPSRPGSPPGDDSSPSWD
jgi:hypothetical protein